MKMTYMERVYIQRENAYKRVIYREEIYTKRYIRVNIYTFKEIYLEEHI